MKKPKLMNNLSLKILSLLAAVLLWLIVVNIEDPQNTETFYNVPVTIENDSVITEAGKVYQVVDNSDVINVTVTARRSVMETLKVSDFTATADMKKLSFLNTLSISVVCSNPEVAENNLEYPQTMEVRVEELDSKKFLVKVETGGTPAEGYELDVDRITSTPESVTVSGPASVIRKINRVVAEVGVDGLSQDSDLSTQLKIYDNNDELIEKTDHITYNIGSDRVIIHVSFLVIKSVKLEYNLKGELGDDFFYTGIESDPDTIRIVGTQDDVADISSITIPFDLSTVIGEDQNVVNAAEHLPDGIRLAADQDPDVLVTVSYEKMLTKPFKIQSGDVQMNGLAEDLVATILDETYDVKIRASESRLDSFLASYLTLRMDLETYNEIGTYQVPVSVLAPSGITIEGDVQMRVRISSRSTTAAEEGGTPDETEDGEGNLGNTGDTGDTEPAVPEIGDGEPADLPEN